MSAVVAYPGNFSHAQQAACAFHEAGALTAFVTGPTFGEHGLWMRLSRQLPRPLGTRIAAELRRRSIHEVPRDLVVSYPVLETVRALLARYARNPIYADMVWDAAAHRFDRTVARRHLGVCGLVHAFEYTARFTFEEARRRGVRRVLALPSPDSREFETIRQIELSRFPALRSRHDGYFADRFERRYERRCAEIALAELIVTNSEKTKDSHVRAGADPANVVALPLAAPPAIEVIAKPASDVSRPLSVVWAGSLSLRKGGYYFLEAWRRLAAGKHAQVAVYGVVSLPDKVLRPVPAGFRLMGSVPQAELFAAFQTADVLVFPTLADGFGMVVTEAFARGLPVITTDRAGASDLVEPGRNGLIVPAADTASLADALRWCLCNRQALYEMRFQALATARRWQWPDYRRRLIATIITAFPDAGLALPRRDRDTGSPACTASPASAS